MMYRFNHDRTGAALRLHRRYGVCRYELCNVWRSVIIKNPV